MFAKARPAFLKRLQILKRRSLEEEQKVSERRGRTLLKQQEGEPEQKVSDSTITTTTKTSKKVKTKNAEAFTKPSGSAYVVLVRK